MNTIRTLFRSSWLLALAVIVLSSWKNLGQEKPLSDSGLRGKKLYEANCIACHMPNGQGLPAVFPPLAKSEYLMKDLPRALNIILNGQSGEIEVNGTKYNGMMTGFPFSEKEVADIMNYITNNWGNQSKEVDSDWVSAHKKK